MSQGGGGPGNEGSQASTVLTETPLPESYLGAGRVCVALHSPLPCPLSLARPPCPQLLWLTVQAGDTQFPSWKPSTWGRHNPTGVHRHGQEASRWNEGLPPLMEMCLPLPQTPATGSIVVFGRRWTCWVSGPGLPLERTCIYRGAPLNLTQLWMQVLGLGVFRTDSDPWGEAGSRSIHVLSGTQESRLGRVVPALRSWHWLVLTLGSRDGTRVGACGLRSREWPGNTHSSSEARGGG